MEHEPQRDARALCDPRGSRPQVPLAKKIKKRIDHGVTRASRSGEPSVDAGQLRHHRKLLHRECNYKWKLGT
jgi:hypothetical protein